MSFPEEAKEEVNCSCPRNDIDQQHFDRSKQRWCVTLLLRPHVTNAFPTDIHFVLHIWFFWLSVPVAKVKMDLHKPKVWHSVTCTSTTSQQLVSCADIHVIVSTSLTVFLSSVFQNMQKCKWTDNIQLGASSWGCRLEVSHISRRIAQTMELISFVGV